MFMKRHRSMSVSSTESDCVLMESRRHNDNNHSRYQESKKVYVSNINFECSLQDLIDEFSSAGEVSFVQMLKGDNRRFKGCAVVTFKDNKMASKAIETLNRHEFQGRKLVVKEEEANPEMNMSRKKLRTENNSDMHNREQSLPSLVDQKTYGLSMSFLSSLNIELPLVTTVFVANLGYDVTERILKEVFMLAGNVSSCEIFKDKDGNSRGFGIVDFEHPVEAVQAISMLHNQSYKDRVLAVRMDRSEKRRDTKVRLPNGLKSVGLGLGADGLPLKDMKSLSATMSPLQSLPVMSPVDSLTGGLLAARQLNSFGGNLMDSLGSSLDLGQNPRVPEITSRSFESTFSGSGTLGNIVRITNLPLDFTSENLRKLIWNCGDVVLAEMRSKGSGIVKLRSDRDAQRAVQMLDRQPLDGRLLSAQLL